MATQGRLRDYSGAIAQIDDEIEENLESFGTTEEIIYSLTRLPSTTHSLLPSSLFDFKNLELASSPCSYLSSNLF